MTPVRLLVPALLAFATTVAPAEAQPVGTTRVSIDSSGAQANGASADPVVSGSGRRVAFESTASDLVTNDTNDQPDVFVRDLRNGSTTRVSVSSSGAEGNGRSGNPSISTNGRWVAFASSADNLVPNDTNGRSDIFVHDLRTATTTRVSLSSSGRQGNGVSHFPSISAEGRRVAFESAASNLVAKDTNSRTDVFVHDLETNKTRRVSLGRSGKQGNDSSYSPSIAGDGSSEGRYVAFVSAASNLVRHDTNGKFDVFFRNLRTRRTKRVSVSSSGEQANRFSFSAQAAVWTGGRGPRRGSLRIAFVSPATNLVRGDTNRDADVFVHNPRSGKTTRVSVSSSAKQGNGESTLVSISSRTHKVAFESRARNLVRRDNNGRSDIFVHNLRTGTTKRVSVSTSGRQGNGGSHSPSISANGGRVAFDSFATNLVRHDTNDKVDVFLHRLK